LSVVLWKFVVQKAGQAQLLTADPDQAQFTTMTWTGSFFQCSLHHPAAHKRVSFSAERDGASASDSWTSDVDPLSVTWRTASGLGCAGDEGITKSGRARVNGVVVSSRAMEKLWWLGTPSHCEIQSDQKLRQILNHNLDKLRIQTNNYLNSKFV
jgi:hypothetical protein